MIALGTFPPTSISPTDWHVPGLVVECGVWRGGMSAAVAESLGPERTYWLLDSGCQRPSRRAAGMSAST